MELKYVLELKSIEQNIKKINESDLEALTEEINGISGCGMAVTPKTPIKTLIKIYKDEKDKLRRHSENDAKKHGITGPKDTQAHFKKCLDGIKAIIDQYLSKTKKENIVMV